jgi:hypothetical protein
MGLVRRDMLLMALTTVYLCTPCSPAIRAEDLAGVVKKAVEKSTLDQPGTKPFHLKATYAPSFERDAESHRNGDVEIWWESPTLWRREVRSPEFHQIEIVDGAHEWQKNEGAYFPEWLRELAVAIVRPIPLPLDVLIQRVKAADVRHLAGQTNINWDPVNGPGDAQRNGNGYVAVMDRTGQLLYTGGPGWSGQYKDFRDFHGRMVAYTVSSGYVEVTAKVSSLEDLNGVPSGFFDTSAQGGDPQPIETVVLDEAELRTNLQPGGAPFVWPPVADGPFEGVVWTAVVIDRTGQIREMIPPVADNPGVKEAADQGFRSMQFKPILRNGVPVQALGKLTVSFKTTRPAGMETFDTARNYFEQGRKASFLSAGATAPYVLHAEFQVGTPGGVQTGRYEDTWISETEWRREAWLGSSHLARSQSGEQNYVLAEGSDAGLLRLVMMIMEPLPAADTMTESDWRIRRDVVDGTNAIRVFRGPEGPNGELEPGKSQGFWFDENGHLVSSYTQGLEIRPSDAEVYGGVQVARKIDVLKDGKTGMRISVTEINPPAAVDAKSFKLKGHEWQRAFTSEVR